MTDRKWHGGYYSPDPDYKDDESIYRGYHTYDSFGYQMKHIIEFDDDGKVVRKRMSDYICREDVINVVEQANGNATWVERDDCKKRLEELPPADVVQVVHSRWILGGYDDMYYVCEECGHKQSEYYHKPTVNFCPNCGAKMDGEEQNA